MQGHMLYRGMKENGEWAMPCNHGTEFHKDWIFKHFKPDVAIGVGQWSYTPDIILHPQKWGVTPVPWLVADGWVANYHNEIGSLPLVLVTSDWVRKTYERDGVDTKNFEVAHIGFNTDVYRPISRLSPKIKTLKELLGIKEDGLVLMTAGGDFT